MPDLHYNFQLWNENYEWKRGGDEWSDPWGSPLGQWRFSLLPRITPYLAQANSVLEIAPGMGRWTQFLLPLSQYYHGVDLSPKCIESCQRRFAEVDYASFSVNNGTSLEVIEDCSVDFAFSFDSLVHAEVDVLEGYLDQFSQKLSKEGIAFIHHSHMAEHEQFQAELEALSYGERRTLMREGKIPNDHARGITVSARVVEDLSAKFGLRCLSQEIVNWCGDLLTDCMTVLCRENAKWRGSNRVLKNRNFMREAEIVSALQSVYQE